MFLEHNKVSMRSTTRALQKRILENNSLHQHMKYQKTPSSSTAVRMLIVDNINMHWTFKPGSFNVLHIGQLQNAI